MKKFVFALALASTAACGHVKSPTAPAAVETVEAPKIHVTPAYHNTPATIEGDESTIVWICTTQPRTYCGERCTVEIDHYISKKECPATPIE
jgi:hypothetical protein